MKYTGEQLAALTKMGLAMTFADGKVTDEEKLVLSMNTASFLGSNEAAVTALLSLADSMEFGNAITILSSMSYEQKKYAMGYLVAIMAADGNIDESEMKLWALTCVLVGLRNANLEDELAFYTSQIGLSK